MLPFNTNVAAAAPVVSPNEELEEEKTRKRD